MQSAQVSTSYSLRHAKSPEQRFSQTLNELFDSLADIIGAMNETGLCVVNDAAVHITKILVAAYDPKTLLESFILHHEHWHHIEKRDPSYVMKDFDQMLLANEIEMDTSIIKEPFTVYERLQQQPGKFGTNPDKWPVNQQDIDTIWCFFDAMVGIACNYVNDRMVESRRPNRVICKSYPKHYDEIDLISYSRRIGFKLGGNQLTSAN